VRLGHAVAIVGVLAVAVITAPGIASASWSATASGAGSSASFSMPAGATPVGTASGRDVAVSWPASTFPNGDPVGGYVVARYDVLTGTPQAVGGACGGVVTSTSCTETGLPPGQWSYAVTPVQHGWTGVEGPPSATVAVDAPLLSLSPTTIGALPATLTGSAGSFLTGEAVTFYLDDPGTPLAGGIAPDPIPAGGATSVSVTIPAGTPRGSHTVYALGSQGTLAGTPIQVVDAAAPTISAAAIGKTQGGSTGWISQGGTYHVYANAADPGDPASGVSSVTADVSAVTVGQTAVPLVAGSYAVGGTTYGYRSAPLTATAPLAEGTVTFSISATDADGNQAIVGGYAVTVDNTPPNAADVQTSNASGGTVGRAETGDTITLTFSETVEPGSIFTGWDGTATTVTVRLVQANPRDRLQVWDFGDTNQLPFGTIDLGRNDYTNATRRFTGSTMELSGTTITITLGVPNGAVGTAGNNGTVRWTPVATPIDLAGNVCQTTTRNETGANDREF
jgi:hypothetical protein